MKRVTSFLLDLNLMENWVLARSYSTVNGEQIKNVVKICCGPHHSLALEVDPD
jgi:hypothetical protein